MEAHSQSAPPASNFHRLERTNLLLRIDVHLEGESEVHCCSGNVSEGGVLLLMDGACRDKLIGKNGVCRIFIGQEFFELPFDVVRADERGVGIHVPAGYDEGFNTFIQQLQSGGNTGMGLDDFSGRRDH